LWRFRLRPGASHSARLDLANPTVVGFHRLSNRVYHLVTGVLIAQIRTAQIKQVGQKLSDPG